jgi:DNA-binding transcriptional LysR family regulator
MLDLERLRALQAVSVHGSVRAAAEAMHVTTSAVSQQLAKLERETGQQLLERSGRGVRLTDAAELLVGHAGKILSLVEEAEADLEAHRGAVVGEIAIAAFATAVRGLVPGALAVLAKRHGDLRVLVEERDPLQSIPLVQRGDLDLAICQAWDNEPQAVPEGLLRTAICDDVADAALPAAHPLAGRDRVALKELAETPWIASTPGSVCYDWLTHTLRSEGLEPRIDHMAYEFASQLSLVDAGLGAAVIPRLGATPVPDGVRLVPLDPSLTRTIYAVWRTEAARRPAIRAVLAALHATVPDLR